MRIGTWGAVAAAAIVAVASGCSTVEPPVYDDDPRVVRLRAEPAEAIDLALTLALPTLPSGPTGDEARHAAPLDARKLQGELLRVLEGEHAFRCVTASAADGLSAQLQEGWDRGDDLVMQVEVRRSDVTYEGTNGWFFPNLFVWFYAWVPSWWIADEVYAANLEVEVRLVSVHSGRVVFRREFTPSVKQDLDDFDRGWGLFATVLPGSLDAEDWSGVAELLVPHVVHELKVELFEAARTEIPTVTQAPAFARDMAKTLYLGIGVTAQKSYRVNNVAWAENDANALGASLQRGLGLDARNVRVVADAQAIKENILGAAREFLVARARASDTVVCYVGGRGMTLPDGRPAIVPYFFEPRNAATDALPLDELLEALEPVAGQLLLILDVGWNGEVGGRGVRYIADVDHGTAEDGGFARCAGARRVTLCAAGPADGAHELDEAQHSLLVHYLLEGLGGAADANDDGQVTAVEALDHTVRETARQAGLLGYRQTPRVWGTPSDMILARGLRGGADGR